jgi:hypothetical protein
VERLTGMELGAALRELSEQGVWRVHLVLSADRKSVSYPQWRLVRAQAVSGGVRLLACRFPRPPRCAG